MEEDSFLPWEPLEEAIISRVHGKLCSLPQSFLETGFFAFYTLRMIMHMKNIQRNKSDTFVPIDVNKGESASVSVKFPFLMRNKQLGACREGGLGSVRGSCLSPPKDQALLGGGLPPLVLSSENNGRLKFK